MSGQLRALRAVATNDLRAWVRSPWAIAAALLPPLGMAGLVAVLTLAVGKQPVALVVQGSGPQAARMAEIFESQDGDAFVLRQVDRPEANRMVNAEKAAAVIEIPADFDTAVTAGNAAVRLILNNVDTDFSDDLRRTVTRSVATFDAPVLGGEQTSPVAVATGEAAPAANPYQISIDEHDQRQTTVDFLSYQVIPSLILVVINVGMLGTALLCVREFENRTVKLLLLSPVQRRVLVAGKLLGGTLATLAVLAPVVALGAFTGVLAPPAAHWLPLLALLLAVTVTAAGFGLVLGVVLRQGRLVTMVGLNVATALFFLGGGFTTIPFLPDWLQVLSRLLPTSYAIDGLRQALFYPDLQGFGRDIIMLVLAAVAAAAIGTASLARGWRRA